VSQDDQIRKTDLSREVPSERASLTIRIETTAKNIESQGRLALLFGRWAALFAFALFVGALGAYLAGRTDAAAIVATILGPVAGGVAGAYAFAFRKRAERKDLSDVLNALSGQGDSAQAGRAGDAPHSEEVQP
jgi:hypothetical protein